jgi:PadR family transcriptional regulator
MENHVTKAEEIENQKLQMRKGMLEFCILLILSKDKKYATEIITELKKADLIVVEGTLYPLLSRLRLAELLHHTWEESQSGPPRKYYSLTEKGRETLHSLKNTWSTLNNSINQLIK